MKHAYDPSGAAEKSLLEALPRDERETLLARLQPTALRRKTVIFEAGEPTWTVHFPNDAVVSLIAPLAEGAVEVATIGNKGVVGIPVVGGRVGCGVRLRQSAGGRCRRTLRSSSSRSSALPPSGRCSTVHGGTVRPDLSRRRLQSVA